MSVAGGLQNALLTAQKKRCTCVQLFCVNQRQWNHPPLSEEQVETFLETKNKTHLSPIVVHGSYLINLAAIEKTTHQKSLKALADQWVRCERLQADYYVIHPGAHMGRGEKAGLDKIVTSINHVTTKINIGKCMLLLEATAGSGTVLGCRFEQLQYILEHVNHPDSIGICLDTSHVFAAGYDIASLPGFDKTIDEFNKTIGLSNLKVVHANDSKTPLNSRVDRHEHIGKGQLGKQAFRNFLTDPRTCNLPYILETPKGTSPGGRDLDMLNLATLRRLAR
ncbi:MAG: deoxyribonuclease IV [Planctomycetes bacterium]|nr:deoxyribonuclease IV [Planctomycetota bacterium]